MTTERTDDIPEPVRKTIGAMVGQAVARCERRGIALADFYQALLAEQKTHPKVSVAELFDRTFRRLEQGMN